MGDIIEEVSKRVCAVVIENIMQREEFVETKKKTFNCNICKKRFKLKLDLNNHRLLHDKLNDNSRPYVCDICGKGYAKRCVMYTHKKRHSNKKPFECPICKKSFQIKGDMTSHQSSRRYRCGICGLEFYWKDAVKRHELSHGAVSEKLFTCQTCGKRFFTNARLRYHCLLHKKKPFACKQCPKTFTYLILLERHEIWHKNGGDRNAPYECKTCNKTFPCKRYLNRHFRSCHDEKTRRKDKEKEHKCPICGKKYNKRYLRIHKLTVHSEKPVLCPICGKQFATEGYLKLHNSRIHNVTKKAKCKNRLKTCKKIKIIYDDHSYFKRDSGALKLSSVSPMTSESAVTMPLGLGIVHPNQLLETLSD